MIIVREPVTNDEFERYYDLRWRILRAPLNQPRGSEYDDLEKNCDHILALDESRIVGVGRLQVTDKYKARIRYMAVEHGYERIGVGSRILMALESRASDLQITVIWLNARQGACGFYQKHGYRITAPGETLFDSLHHYRMEKNVCSSH